MAKKKGPPPPKNNLSEKAVTLHYGMEMCDVLKLHLTIPDLPSTDPEVVKPFAAVRTHLRVSEDIQRIEILLEVGLKLGESVESSVLMGWISTFTTFKIRGLEDAIDPKDNNRVVIPSYFILNLINTALATTRGVFMVVLGTTQFAGMVLPMVPDAVLFPGDRDYQNSIKIATVQRPPKQGEEGIQEIEELEAGPSETKP